MEQKVQIAFLLCDGNTRIEVPSENLPFRELSKHFQIKIPYEFVLLLDLNTNQLRSKNEILNNGSVLKIIDARMELETVKFQKNQIDKFEADIQQLKQQISQLEQLNEQYQTQYLNEKSNAQSIKKISDKQNKELIELRQEGAINKETIKKLEFREHEWNLKNSIIQELKDKVIEQEKKIENYLLSLSESRAKVTIAEDKYKIIQGKYESKKQFKKKFHEKEFQNQQLQNQIQMLEKKIKKYKKLKSEYQNQQEQFRSQIQENTQQNTQHTKQQSQIQSELKDKYLKLEQQLNTEKLEKQKLTDKLQNYEKIKKENEQLKQEKTTLNQIIKDLQQSISNQDSSFLQKIERQEIELQNLKSSKLEIIFRHKLLKMIELIPRIYFSEIKFAIENFYNNGVFKSLKPITTNLKVYQIQYKRKDIEQVLFSPSLDEITSSFKMLWLSDKNGVVTTPIESITNISEQEGTIIDQLSIFQTNTIGQKLNLVLNFQNSYFALKTIKNKTFNQQYDEKQSILYENTQENAMKYIANLIVSKEILNEFQQDLIAFGKQIEFKHQFTNFYIFSKTHSFKDIIVLMKNSIREKDKIPKAFHFLYDFVLELAAEASNNFFDQLQEINVQIKQNKKNNKPLLIKPIFQDFLVLCKCQSKVIKNINNFSEQEIIEAIQYFFILNYDFPKAYPFEKFYPAYEIIFDVNQKQQLIQYNGGHLSVNYQLKESSYYQALSYYSIVKTNGQYCLSYLQRIGEYLYEPLISTQDGFFSSMDQGLSEIRTIESTFLSSKYYPEWKGFFEWLSKKALE